MKIFVTGIGTGVGKTVVSAILVEALHADYWKPVQCGYPRDTEVVSELVSSSLMFHPEKYLLDEPASPHQAAFNQGMELRLADINLPQTKNDLIIEGAGGVMVPINQTELILDLIVKFANEVVLVANLYLGSINHTLLTVDALQSRGQKIIGIVFNGPSNQHSESIIKSYSGCDSLLHLPPDSVINSENIKQWAQILRKNLASIY